MTLNHVCLASLVAILWGFNFVVLKIGLTEIPQFLFSGLRFLLVAFPLILFVPKPKTSWLYIAGFGFMQGFLSFACIFKGMSLGMTAGLSSIILQTHIIFALIFSYFILNIKPTMQQILGVLVSIIGMYLIATSIDQSIISFSALSMLLISAVFWALANIFLKLAGSVNIFGFIVWSSVFAAISNLICSYFFEGTNIIINSLQALSHKGYASLFCVVVFATWIAGTMQAYLIREYSPAIVSPYALLIPIVGMASSSFVLDETMALETIFASLIVFIGLVINQLPSRKKQDAAPFDIILEQKAA